LTCVNSRQTNIDPAPARRSAYRPINALLGDKAPLIAGHYDQIAPVSARQQRQ